VLRSDDPDEMRFGINLAMCYRALGQIDRLRSLVEELIERRRHEAERAEVELREFVHDLRERRRQEAENGQNPAEVAAGDPPDRASALKLRKLRQAAHLDRAALDFLMGFVLSAEGDAEAALEHLRRAERSRSGRPVLHVQIGETYLQLRRWADAERSFVRATEIDAENPHAELGICRSLLPRRKNRQAAESALRAVALLHEYPMAHYCLGIALHRMGHLERAVQALEVAVTQNPNFLEAHERLAKIYRRRLHDPQRAEPHEEMVLAIRYGIRTQDSEAEPSAAIPAATESALSFPSLRPDRSVDPTQVITVVSGLPRTGTSLMMQMLAAGGLDLLSDGEREADEDNPRGYYELEKVKALRADASWLGDARGKVIKVIAQLLPHLPRDFHYQVIFMQRDLHEVLTSQAQMLERRGASGAALDQRRLAAAFEGQLERVRKHLVHREVPTHLVHYRDAVSNPLGVAEDLVGFCGQPLDLDAMAEVVDPALYRQRRGENSAD
jgi:tetratricopeptide (TPR) repeat protein